jgi:GGDEF domain-containing protein
MLQAMRCYASSLTHSYQLFAPYDVTARLGGDEFAFCLAVRDEAAAKRKAGKGLIDLVPDRKSAGLFGRGVVSLKGPDIEQIFGIAPTVPSVIQLHCQDKVLILVGEFDHCR